MSWKPMDYICMENQKALEEFWPTYNSGETISIGSKAAIICGQFSDAHINGFPGMSSDIWKYLSTVGLKSGKD